MKTEERRHEKQIKLHDGNYELILIIRGESQNLKVGREIT